MNNTSFNRMILLICFMALVAVLATCTTMPAKDLVMVVGAVAGPLLAYIGIKGPGNKPGNNGSGS